MSKTRKVSYRSNLDYMVCMKENQTHLGSIGSIYLLLVFVSGVDDTMDTTVSAA